MPNYKFHTNIENFRSVIMFVVEDVTYNVYDQRVIEFKVREFNQEIMVIRKTFEDLLTESQLGPNKELLV